MACQIFYCVTEESFLKTFLRQLLQFKFVYEAFKVQLAVRFKMFIVMCVNLSMLTGPSTETPQNIDYEFAQQELMQQEMGNDPIQAAISDLEKEHEKDKEGK